MADDNGKTDSPSLIPLLRVSITQLNVATTCLRSNSESIRSGREKEYELSCGPDNIDTAKRESEED